MGMLTAYCNHVYSLSEPDLSSLINSAAAQYNVSTADIERQIVAWVNLAVEEEAAKRPKYFHVYDIATSDVLSPGEVFEYNPANGNVRSFGVIPIPFSYDAINTMSCNVTDMPGYPPYAGNWTYNQYIQSSGYIELQFKFQGSLTDNKHYMLQLEVVSSMDEDTTFPFYLDAYVPN
jgi:hypothetical protein